ncbi:MULTISPECIES: hypothetical protein [unclassified Novosphingobium]|uniref:hypothetical protein n=1 Tax=unclassified Novosphingobium TaxID=2644732 RepID=UPI00135A7619|nr:MULTISPECIES: hypothetical protein [unclassified Novosphingobium]
MVTAALAFLVLVAAPAASYQQALAGAPPPVVSVERGAPSCAAGCMSAIEAVTYASYLGTKAGVAGIFEMPVVEVGQQNGMFYLNSETDYRDRNCLTVAMTPRAMNDLVGTTDLADIRERLRSRRVIVNGIARQVRINFLNDGRPTGKYYYQIHVRVGDAGRVRIVG